MSIIEHIALQNPWWRDPSLIEQDPKVAEALAKTTQKKYSFKRRWNSIILGPRQVGKTTYIKLFIRQLLREGVQPRRILYYTCELLNDAKEIADVISLFDKVSASAQPRYVFLDEVTFTPKWESAVKYVLDTPLSEGKIIYVTGSSSIWLKKGYEKLPGRKIAVKIFMPLTFREYAETFGSVQLKQELQKISSIHLGEQVNLEKIYEKATELIPHQQELTKLFYGYIRTGGFFKPSYEYLQRGEISPETYQVYIKWIEGDLARLDRKVSLLRSIISGIIDKYTTRFSYATLARQAELGSHVTAREYLEVLEGLLLIRTFYQADKASKKPNLRKEKKVYFTDPFLYSAFKGYMHEIYSDYSLQDASKIVEGIIAEHLARQFRDHHSRVTFYVEKGETDFAVLTQSQKYVGIEVKWQKNVSLKDFNNRHRFKTKILVSKNDLEYLKKENMLIISAPIILTLLSQNDIYKFDQ
ncbi:MAG: ATP-binding protein [Thermoprotei archaeon]|nr:MAG: ATP-binding protein [Thermoprotei archaeon]